MTDMISRERLRKKVLDRWENEGGKIPANRIAITSSGSPGKRAVRDHAAHSAEDLPKALRQTKEQ